MAASVKHSRETNEQYTSEGIVDMSRRVLGNIDTDPATSELANTRIRAKIIYTIDDGERTFEETWHGNVFMNPPGGKELVVKGLGLRSNTAIFWAKLMHDWHVEQTVRAAIVIGFTMEVLQSSQGVLEYPMARFPLCVPGQRLKFDVPREEKLRQIADRLEKLGSARGKERQIKSLRNEYDKLAASDQVLVSGDDPPHGNVIVLVPPREEHHFGVSDPLEDEPEYPWVTWDGPITRKFLHVFSSLGYVRI